VSSETDTIRAMLDERGAEYMLDQRYRELFWDFGESGRARASAIGTKGFVQMIVTGLTPEQVIDATLGPMTCQADETDTWECVCDGIGHYGERMTIHVMECSECGRTYEHVNGGYECCPHCGRRIVEVSE